MGQGENDEAGSEGCVIDTRREFTLLLVQEERRVEGNLGGVSESRIERREKEEKKGNGLENKN